MSIIQKAVQSQSARRPEQKPAETPSPVPAARTPANAVRPASPAAFAPLIANGFLQVDPADPALRSELRLLKRAVLQCAFGPLADAGANVVMITSAMPGAGKTFLSANLTQAFAMERDRTTLLIDGDDTRSTMSRALGLHGIPGFFDVMHDPKLSFQTCTHTSDVPGLEFIPAGSRFDDSLELLTSNRAREVIQKLAAEDRNRLIVIDCPPLLGTPNAVALSALAGQILVVVEAGETTEPTIIQALELLDRDKPIGLVLNKVPRAPLLTLGHGGYYYYTAPDGE